MTVAALGQFIKAERERQHLTLRQLEKLSGVSSSMISKIENDYIKSLSMDTLDGIAKGLRIDPNTLIRIARGEEQSTGPTEEIHEANLQRLIEITNALPIDEREEVLEYARMRLRRLQEKRKE